MEGKSRAITLLPRFQVVEEAPDIGEEQVADLGLFLDRRIDLGKRVLEIPMPVGE